MRPVNQKQWKVNDDIFDNHEVDGNYRSFTPYTLGWQLLVPLKKNNMIEKRKEKKWKEKKEQWRKNKIWQTQPHIHIQKQQGECDSHGKEQEGTRIICTAGRLTMWHMIVNELTCASANEKGKCIFWEGSMMTRQKYFTLILENVRNPYFPQQGMYIGAKYTVSPKT